MADQKSYPSELRRGSLSNRWVMIAAGRAHRPHDWIEPGVEPNKRDPFDPTQISPDDITDRVPNNDGTTYHTDSDWKTLSIVNKFPFLDASGAKPKLTGQVRDGYGYHEIVIHSPDADQNFEDFSPEQTEAVIELYFKRYNHLSNREHIRHVQIFTNRGPEAGASVTHPHSQIVALPIVPPYIDQLAKAAAAYHNEHGRSVAEDEVKQEREQAVRVVYENSKFLVYCPFAPHADYHVRIMPKHSGSFFHEITQDQVEHLAKVINLSFRRLNRIAGTPPYNAFVRTGPVGAKRLPGFRWHIDIVPHLSVPGGMELSTGLDVVTVSPEEAARALRQDA